jgi:hypothetical protein
MQMETKVHLRRSGDSFDGPDHRELNIENQDHEKFGLAIVRLDEGKTFEDLDAWGRPLLRR